MKLNYLQLTTIRVLFGIGMVSSLLTHLGLLALAFSIGFIGLHWVGQAMGQRKGLEKEEYRYSSLLSSFIILFVFVVLLSQEVVPIILAAVFISVFVIKIMFSMQDKPMVSEEREKPVKTNWSLSASVLFMSCYYFGYDHNLMLISVGFLSYLVLSLGIYAQSVMMSRGLNKPRLGD